MCTWVAAAQIGLQAFGMAQQSRANAKMAEAQARGAIKEMNYSFQNYEQNRRDAFDAAVNDIVKTRINQMQLNSGVNAAVNEGMGSGRTADRLIRAAAADTSRVVASIQENYGRKSNEIDLNKEAKALSTKDYLANLKEQSKPNKLADMVNLAGTALNAYGDYRMEKAKVEASGGKMTFWGAKPGKTTKVEPALPKFNTEAVTKAANSVAQPIARSIMAPSIGMLGSSPLFGTIVANAAKTVYEHDAVQDGLTALKNLYVSTTKGRRK